MLSLSKAVLSTLRVDAKRFTVATETVADIATTIATTIEGAIPSKYLKLRTVEGQTLQGYKDEVQAVFDAMPDVAESLKGGVVEGVADGKSYKDYSFNLVDNGGVYAIADEGAKPDRSFTATQLRDLDTGKLKLVANKKGINNNPEGTYGPSLHALLDKSKRLTFNNSVDKAWGRLKSAIAKQLGDMHGIVTPEVDEVDKAISLATNCFKALRNKAELMSADDRKGLMAWITKSQSEFPLK
jgi:hypothetical protein